MDFARHHVESNRLVDDVAVREHWEAAARKGNPEAIAKLRGPEMPESVAYLWLWILELHGRSGATMSGLAPLSYETIAHWSTLTGRNPDPLEVRALIDLDSVLMGQYRDPDAKAPEPDEQPVRDDAWPERKNG